MKKNQNKKTLYIEKINIAQLRGMQTINGGGCGSPPPPETTTNNVDGCVCPTKTSPVSGE